MSVRPALARLTVLLVDDEPDILGSIQDVLHATMPEARVMAAASGEEAIRILRETPVHLVASDFRLPGMDGLAFLVQARRLAPRAPRLLVSGFGEAEVDAAALDAAEVSAVLMKPIDAQEFVALVRATLAAPMRPPRA